MLIVDVYEVIDFIGVDVRVNEFIFMFVQVLFCIARIVVHGCLNIDWNVCYVH